MRNPTHRLGGDSEAEAGETLLEVLIASTLMAIVVVAIVGGIATMLLGAHVHREQADGNSALVAAMEYLKRPPSNPLDPTTGVKRECTNNADMYLAGLTSASLATGITIAGIEYETIDSSGQVVWAPTGCSLTNMLTLQRITLKYTSPDKRVDPPSCLATAVRAGCLSFIRGDV